MRDSVPQTGTFGSSLRLADLNQLSLQDCSSIPSPSGWGVDSVQGVTCFFELDLLASTQCRTLLQFSPCTVPFLCWSGIHTVSWLQRSLLTNSMSVINICFFVWS